MFPKSERPPEGDAFLVVDEHLEREGLAGRDDPLPEKLDRALTQPLSSMSPVDEELAQVRTLIGGSQERVGYWRGRVLEDDGAVVALQPLAHPVRELDDGHRVGSPLILDELMVQLSEERNVLIRRIPELHAASRGFARAYTETCPELDAVKGERSHPAHRSRSSRPASRAIRSSSLGHA